MSTSIRVSYERPEELERIIHKLRPWIEKAKFAKSRPGEYRRAYLTLADIRENKPENECLHCTAICDILEQ